MRKNIVKITALSVLSALLLSGCSGQGTTGEVTIAEKPVIYLYGYDSEDVTVKLNFDGKLTMTYPEASNNTWRVKAEEDGTLKIGETNYRYLFWEGASDTEWSFKKGFCVKGSNTVSFLKGKLEDLGLNDQETEDFITYWGPRMINNKYNIISFQTTTYTNAANLTVTPAPDKTFRVFMAYYPSDTEVDMEAQSFKVPNRNGKVLVEWGGVEVNKEDVMEEVSDNTITKTTSSGTTSNTSKDNQTSATDGTKTETTNTGTTNAVQTPVVTDPYAQYGSQAQCAKDWDSTAATKCGQTWAQLDAGTRTAAYNHWLGHGTSGW